MVQKLFFQLKCVHVPRVGMSWTPKGFCFAFYGRVCSNNMLTAVFSIWVMKKSKENHTRLYNTSLVKIFFLTINPLLFQPHMTSSGQLMYQYLNTLSLQPLDQSASLFWCSPHSYYIHLAQVVPQTGLAAAAKPCTGGENHLSISLQIH